MARQDHCESEPDRKSSIRNSLCLRLSRQLSHGHHECAFLIVVHAIDNHGINRCGNACTDKHTDAARHYAGFQRSWNARVWMNDCKQQTDRAQRRHDAADHIKVAAHQQAAPAYHAHYGQDDEDGRHH